MYVPCTSRRELLVGATAIVGTLPALAGAANASASSELARAADKLVVRLHASNKAPAFSVAVARPDALVWAAAYGSADLELRVPATPDHLFRLGSVSKVLTSTIAARLASRKLLDLDAPISTWLDGLPDQHRQTSLRQLLTHRGGVRHYLPKDLDASSPGGPIFQRSLRLRDEILAIFINDPLVGRPGSTVSYSTFGFSLASFAMEAVARRPFLQLVAAELGQGFGLSSLAEDDPMAIRPLRVNGYMDAAEMQFLYPKIAEAARPVMTDGWANAPRTDPGYSWAGAGFMMSPTDTARFGAALIASPHSRISAEERAILFTPMTEAAGNMPPLGLGWRVDFDGKKRLRWHHAGATPGGRASLVIYPELHLSIAIATNVMNAPGNVLAPSSDIADLFA